MVVRKKISQLPAADQANDADLLETSQGAASRRLTVGQVAARVLDRVPPAGVNVFDKIPRDLWEDIEAGTSIDDVLPWLQEAADDAEARRQPLIFPAGTFTTFGELSVKTSVLFQPGAILRVTRDDLAGLLVQGYGLLVVNPRLIGAYATPAIGGNPAGSRIKRNGGVTPWNGYPYNQGGFARCPFRDRNAGIIAINADFLTIENAYAENFNVGIHARGSYVASNAVPAPGLAYDWCADGSYGAPGDGKARAPIAWAPGLQNDTNGDVGYMVGLRILFPRFAGCDMPMMLSNHIGCEIVDPVNEGTTLVQNSPPHMVYFNSTDGLNYPNRNCKVRGGSDVNNVWSHSMKFEFHQNLLVDGLDIDGAFGGIIAADCDDSTFRNVNGRNLATPFATLSGSWATAADVVTLNSTAQVEVGLFLASATYGLPRPCEVVEIIDATHVRIEGHTEADSGSTVTIWLTTNSSSSTLVANLGSQRAVFDRITGNAVAGEADTFGISSRASANRVLSRFALSTGGGAAGAATITFETATFPVGIGAGWLARMLPFWLPAGSRVLSAIDAAGVTTVTLNANFLRAVPVGTWAGFYREIIVTTTADAAAGANVLAVASTAGLETAAWWCQEGAAFRHLTRIAAAGLTGTAIPLTRTLRAALPAGSLVTFRSDKFSDLYMPDDCVFTRPAMDVERPAPTDPVLVFKTEGSNCSFYDPNVVARPVSGAATAYGLYIGGHRKGHYGNRIIRPTLKGLLRIANIDARGGGVVVDAINALLQSGTDASTVKDDPGIVAPTKYILDGMLAVDFSTTVALVGATIAGANTYSTRQAIGRRWGDMCHVLIRLSLSQLLSTGALTIGPLPWVARSSITGSAVTPGFVPGVTVAANELLEAKLLAASNMLTLFRRGLTGGDAALNAGAVSGSALVTAAIAAGVMTVSAVTNGTLAVGQVISTAAGAIVGTIASLGTGTGGTGTYNLAGGVDTASAALSASGGATTGRFDLSLSYITSDPF
jgi:hypothetical protein